MALKLRKPRPKRLYFFGYRFEMPEKLVREIHDDNSYQIEETAINQQQVPIVSATDSIKLIHLTHFGSLKHVVSAYFVSNNSVGRDEGWQKKGKDGRVSPERPKTVPVPDPPLSPPKRVAVQISPFKMDECNALFVDLYSLGEPYGNAHPPSCHSSDFSPEAFEAVDTISKKLSTSKSEALRKALGLMRFVLEEKRKGAKLIIEGPTHGERREIIQL